MQNPEEKANNTPNNNTNSAHNSLFQEQLDQFTSITYSHAPRYLRSVFQRTTQQYPPEPPKSFSNTRRLVSDPDILATHQINELPQVLLNATNALFSQEMAKLQKSTITPEKRNEAWKKSIKKAIKQTKNQLPLAADLINSDSSMALFQTTPPPTPQETEARLHETLRTTLTQPNLPIKLDQEDIETTIEHISLQILENSHASPEKTVHEILRQQLQQTLSQPHSSLDISETNHFIEQTIIPQVHSEALKFSHSHFQESPNRLSFKIDPFLATGQKTPLIDYRSSLITRTSKQKTINNIGASISSLNDRGYDTQAAFGSFIPLTAYTKGYRSEDIKNLIKQLQKTPRTIHGRILGISEPDENIIKKYQELQTNLQALEKIFDNNSKLLSPVDRLKSSIARLKTLPRRKSPLGIANTLPYALKEWSHKHDKLLHPLRFIYKPFIAIDRLQEKYNPTRIAARKVAELRRYVRRKIGNKLRQIAEDRIKNKALKALLTRLGVGIASASSGVGTALFLISLTKDLYQLIKHHGKDILKWAAIGLAALGGALWHMLSGLIIKFGLSFSVGTAAFVLSGFNPIVGIGAGLATYGATSLLPQITTAAQSFLSSASSFLTELVTSTTPAIAQTAVMAGAGTTAAIGGAYLLQENIHKEIYTVPITNTEQSINITPAEGACWPVSGNISQGVCAEQLCFDASTNEEVVCSHCSYNSANNAIDIAGPVGSEVQAYHSGTVSQILQESESEGYGLVIFLTASNGEETVYAHLSSVGVQINQPITKGQTIGYTGSTGNSTGPHLHFEYRTRDIRQVVPSYQVHDTVAASCRL